MDRPPQRSRSGSVADTNSPADERQAGWHRRQRIRVSCDNQRTLIDNLKRDEPGRQGGHMNVLRVLAGNIIVIIGLAVVIVVFLFIVFAVEEPTQGPIALATIVALVGLVVIVGLFFVFKYLMDSTPPDDDGA
jgi:hypothetical protein